MVIEKTVAILPTKGADDDCDTADAAVEEIEDQLQALLQKAQKSLW